MKIIINDQQSIPMIKEQFNRLFPFLKLEFFSKPHLPGHTSKLKFLQPWNKKIGEIRTHEACGVITIHPDMSARELEQLFRQEYGLYVQIFRKFGTGWIETAITDDWSLKEQNLRGKQELHTSLTSRGK